MSELRILRRSDVIEKTGLSRGTIENMREDGTFPMPVKLGPRSIGWIESEVDEWIQQKIEERDQAHEDLLKHQNHDGGGNNADIDAESEDQRGNQKIHRPHDVRGKSA